MIEAPTLWHLAPTCRTLQLHPCQDYDGTRGPHMVNQQGLACCRLVKTLLSKQGSHSLSDLHSTRFGST